MPGELLLVNTAVGRPQYMVTQGNWLWIADMAGDPYIHVVDLSARRLLVSYGRTGVGPGDFDQAMSSLALRPGDTSAAWAFGGNLMRLTRMPATGPGTPAVVIPIALHRFVFRVYWLTRQRLLGIGDADSNRFNFIDSTGRLLLAVRGELVGPDSIPLRLRSSESTAFSLCIKSAAARVVVFHVHAGRMDLYDSTATLIRHGDVPFATNGSFRRDSAGEWHPHDIRRYYEACSSSPTRIYALFSGKRVGPHGGVSVVEAQFVHVFDWAGHFLGALQLDRPLSGMTTSGDSVLYGAASDGSGIFVFRLPPFAPADPGPAQQAK